MGTKVIRIVRSDVKVCRMDRKEHQIKSEQYAKSVSPETLKRFYVSQNIGVQL
jgi:hypothetical protein